MVSLGTPLSPHATTVLLLGSGELGKEVVIELQRLGVETVAVDRYADAPAMQVAHRSRVIDMQDAEALRALLLEERPDLVVPELEAIATSVLAELEQDGFRVIPTARAAVLTMNREGIRRLAAEELGLPTSPYAFVDTIEEFGAAADELGWPVVVKPVMSSSGHGQSLVHEPGRACGRVGLRPVRWPGHPDVALHRRRIHRLRHRDHDAHRAEPRRHFVLRSGVPSAGRRRLRRVVAGTGRHDVPVARSRAASRGDGDVRDGWLGRVRRRAVHPRRRRDLLRSVPAPARHRFGDAGQPGRQRVRAPRPRRARPSGGHHPLARCGGELAAEGARLRRAGLRRGGRGIHVDPSVQVRLFAKPRVDGERRIGVALARGATTDEARARARAAAEAMAVRLEG